MSRITRMILTLAAVIMMTASVPMMTQAAETACDNENQLELDSADNLYFGGNAMNIDNGVYFGGFGAGQNLFIQSAKFKDSTCLAAKSVLIDDTEIGGSIFAAAYDVHIRNVQTDGNLIFAGFSLDVDSRSSANAVIAAGKQISFNGTARSLRATADTVTINGTIDGDVNVTCSKLVLGENAKIAGTVNVSAKDEPMIADTASIGAVNYTKAEEFVEEAKEAAVVEMPEETVVDLLLHKAKSTLYWLAAFGVMALFAIFFARGHVEKAGELVFGSPAAVLVSGLITLCAFPILFILMCVTVIGIPLAIMFLITYVLLICFSGAVCGTVIGVKKLPMLHPILAALVGIGIYEVLVHIPYVGAAVKIAAIFCALGLVIRMLWNGRSRKKAAAAAETNDEATEVQI